MTDVQILRESGGVDPRRISMRLGDACLSRLVRHGNDVPDWPEAPPVALAFRFGDNWRRTQSARCRIRPPAHEIAATASRRYDGLARYG